MLHTCFGGWDLHDLDHIYMFHVGSADLRDLRMYHKVGPVRSRSYIHVLPGGICVICVICTCLPGGICIICMICHIALADVDVPGTVYGCSRVTICVGSCISETLYTRSDIHRRHRSPRWWWRLAAQAPPPMAIRHTATAV